jgi:Big-like domain-containing protein
VTVHRSAFRWILLASTVVAAVRCGGGDGVVTPREGLPAAIAAVGGQGQTGPVGQVLADSLIVLVTDSRNRPVKDTPVEFSLVAGGTGADLVPDTAITDDNGRARSRWVLGSIAGAQRVEARVLGQVAAGTLKTSFNATALAGPADTIFALSGNGQVNTAGQILPESLVVAVTDRLGNPIAGQVVSWSVTGGGSVSAPTTATGANGRAAVRRTLGPTAGVQTASATVAGLRGSPVLFTHTATAGGAAAVVKVSGDGQTAPAGFALTDSIVVRVVDGSGNGVAGRNVNWVILSGGGHVSPQTSVTNAQGLTFSYWTLGPVAGSNAVAAVVSGLPQVQFDATGSAAQPGRIDPTTTTTLNGTAGSPVTPVPAVKVVDANTNPVQGITVTFQVTAGGGTVSDGAASAAQVTVSSDASGVASLASWTLGTVAGTNTLTASAAGAGGAPLTGSPVTFTAQGQPGSAAQVVFTTQPSAAVAVGQIFPTQPVLQLEDANGNSVSQSGRIVVLSVTGGGATLRGTASVTTNSVGQATFSGLSLVGPVGTYTLTAAVSGLASDASSPIALAAGPAAALAIVTQPSASASSGVPFGQQPVVQVVDSAGNPLAAPGVAVTAAIATGGGALGGTTTVNTDVNGRAVFTNLSISGAAGGRTLSFSTAGLTGATSSVVTLGAGAPAQLAMVQQPSSTAQSGSVLAVQPIVQLEDGSGNPVALAGVGVTATVSGGAALAGTTTISTSGTGQAVFSGLAVTGSSGSYTLSFSATSLTGVTSAPITLSAGLATAVTFTVSPPATGQSGVALSPTVVVQLRDAANNPVAQSGVPIGAQVLSGPGGTLTGASALTNASGAASFAALTLSGPIGSYVLQFTGAGLTPATSGTLVLSSGPASQLAMVTQPAAGAQSGVTLPTQPVVELQDGAGNPVNQAGVTVTATIASGGGTLGGTVSVATTAGGQAAFTNLVITGTVGTRTLGFGATGVTPAVSAPIVLAAGPATTISKAAGDLQTATAGTTLPINPTVLITDQSGNPVAGVVVGFAVTQGNGLVGAASVVTGTNGQAAVSWTIGTQAGSNSLTATAPVGGVTFTATGVAGSAGRLAILIQPPASSASGSVLFPGPQIQLQDQNGNPVLTSGVQLTVNQTGPPGGLLSGTTTVTSSLGSATFSNLTLAGPIGSYTLTFSDVGSLLTGVTSNPISLQAGPAAQVRLTTRPSAAAPSGSVFAQQPVVQVQDASGNPVTGNETITAAIQVGSGALLGTTSVATGGGSTATFTNLAVSGTAGTFLLRFFPTALLPGDTASVVITAGPAASIAAASATGQSALVGTAVSAAPSVVVRDAAANPVAGVIVTFAVTGGSGSINGASQVTDASGIATVTGWTLGPAAGLNTVTATATGGGISGNPVTFSATGTAGAATTIALNAGNGQAATVNTPVATAPSVKVTDANGNAVSGVAVTFAVGSGGGSITGASQTTGAGGLATVGSWTLGTLAGSNTLTATAGGLAGSPVTFTATGTAGSATTLAKVAGDNQTATSGTLVPVAPQVLATDQFGNPVGGVSVMFAVASGGGSATGTGPTTNGSGLAAVGSWTLGPLAGTNTLTATATGLAGSPATFTATGTIGGATKLALTTQPSATAQSGVALATQPVVQVEDANGNPVAQAGLTVTASFSTGSGTLAGAQATTSPAGTATFSGLTITGSIGSYAIAFNTGSLTGAVSNAITLSAGPIAALAVARQPSTAAQSGAAFATQPQIQLIDAAGNNVSQNGVIITAAIVSGPAGGTLANASATTSSGLATFAGLGITGTAGSYTLEFQTTGLAPVGANPISLTAGTASQLTITVPPPPTSSSGAVLSPAPQIQLRDAAGNAVSQSGVTVTAAIASGTGGSLTGTVATTSAAGVATFSSLALSGPTGSFTLSFSATGLTSAISSAISLGAGSASKLALTTSPSSTTPNGAVLAQQPVIQLQDASGNPVSQAGVTVTANILSGGGTLGGTTAVSTNGAGQAAFTDLSITGTVGSRTLLFAAGGFVSVSSGSIDVTPGPATGLSITTEPSASAQSGVAFAQQPVIQLRDQSDNAVSQSGVSVSAAIAFGGGAVIGTAAVNTDGAGAATFTDLGISGTAGPHTLRFSASTLNGVTSATIALGAGPAAVIAVSAGNGQTATVNSAVAIAPAVLVTDASGNPVSGVTVTFAVATGGGSALGTSPTTNGSGIATVGSWTLGTVAGPNSLTATATGGGITGNPVTFTATATAAAASQLAMVTQPSATAQSGIALAQQPAVRLADAFGNPVSQSGVDITAAIASGGGTLGGTTTVATGAGGVAAFTDLSLSGLAGSRTLGFSSTGLTGATSAAISLSAGAAANIAAGAGNGQSATVGTAVSTAPGVLVTDGSGNPVSGVAVTFAVATGGGSATGTAATTDGSGVATVGSWTLGTTAGANTLTATATGLSGSPVTFTATGTAGAAAALAFSVQPGGTTAGVAISPAPAVRVVDGFGNTVTGATTSITVALVANPGPATLSGVTTQNAVSGVATFSGLSLDVAASGYTLGATGGGLAAATSSSFTISPAAASQLVITTQPSGSATSGSVLSQQPVVRLEDPFGNPVSQASVTITAALASGTGTLGGTTGLATSSAGVVAYTDLSITGPAGTYTIGFSATGLTGAVSNSIGLGVAGTTTSITAHTPDPSVVGQSVVFDVAVSGTGATPTGTVTVSDGTQSCLVTLSGGVGSCSIAFAGAGTRSVSATYSGDSSHGGSTSVTVTQTVNAAATTTSITADPTDPSVVGQAYTVSYGVGVTAPGAGSPGGNVTVSDGQGGSCTATVAAGSCSLTSLAAGAVNLTATYAGSSDFNGSTSSNEPHTVNAGTPVVAVTGHAPDPSVTGQDVAVSVSVTGGGVTPTGGVTVTSGTDQCTIAALAGGTGGCSLTLTSAGARTITAGYAGDANYAAASSAGTGHTVNPAATATAITADPTDPSAVSQAYTVSYTVTATAPGSGTPAGNVTVSDGQGATCTATVAAGSCSLTSTVAGVLSLTAGYAGSSDYAASTSGAEPHTVSGIASSTAITGHTPDPSVVGESVSFDVSVTGSGPTPTGTVTVSDGSQSCPVTLSGGTGSCSIGFSGAGTRTVTATYGGDGAYGGSTSSSVSQTVNAAATTTSITADPTDPSVVGQSYSVSYTVSATAPGSGIPTGNVTVSDGQGGSCTATVAAGSCSLASSAAGSVSLTADYQGSADFTASTSATEPHTVGQAATTTSITADPTDPSVVGQPYSVSYTVTATAPGSGAPTGNVTVSDGQGGSCTATVAAGSCSLASSAAGAVSLTASYAGSTDFAGGTSAAEPHTVGKAATSLAITGTTPNPSAVNQPYTVSWSVSVTAPGAGTPTGTVTASDGAASCNAAVGAGSCVITSTTAGAKTITVTYGGDANFNGSSNTTSQTVDAFGTATTLVFSRQPTNTKAGTAIKPPVQVSVQDGFGNTVTTATDAVTLIIDTNPSGGTLTNGGPVSAISGVATFTGLSINLAGNGYVLRGQAAGLTDAVSVAFNITP